MSLHSLARGADLHEDKRVKQECTVVATSNVLITSPGATIDGVTLSSGNRVLLTAQTAPAENGIYAFNGSGFALTRTSDASNTADFPAGFFVYVTQGTVNATTYWIYTTVGAVTLGTTALAFTKMTMTGPTGATGPTGPTGPTGAQGVAGAVTFQTAGETPYILIQDIKSSGTNGGTFTSGSFQTRTLNTVTADRFGILISFSSNQFTLPAGTYRILAESPAFLTDRHQARLMNISDSAVMLNGTSSYNSSSGTQAQTTSIVRGIVAIASQKTFELQHRCSVTAATNGLGIAANYGNNEIYSSVEIWLISGPPLPPGAQMISQPMPKRRPILPESDMQPISNTLLPV